MQEYKASKIYSPMNAKILLHNNFNKLEVCYIK